MEIQKFRFIFTQSIRKCSTAPKRNFQVNQQVFNNIENGSLKPGKHPGIFKPRIINLPVEFVEAATKALSDYPVKQLLTDSSRLVNYLHARHAPLEKEEYIIKRRQIENDVLSKVGELSEISEEQRTNLNHKLERRINKIIKSKVYTWKPVDYNIHTSLQYLVGRAAAEYAVLRRIFQEIIVRDHNFKPRSFFDFGSGVGTGTWAARYYWEKHIFEYFNVDCSVHMNDLALILLKGGTGVREPNLKGVFYRQFLPATKIAYDLVLCAYSLFELPCSTTRLQVILNLWNKTKDYLILVENGTNAGFQLVNEARDFILDIKDENNAGYVFSPCPHDKICPKFVSRPEPCNFEISYKTIPVGQNSIQRRENFSYVILRKGKRLEEERWSRAVQPTQLRSRHVICRLCTASGSLRDAVFTESKHGRVAYRCAKATEWGDLLPINVQNGKES